MERIACLLIIAVGLMVVGCMSSKSTLEPVEEPFTATPTPLPKLINSPTPSPKPTTTLITASPSPLPSSTALPSPDPETGITFTIVYDNVTPSDDLADLELQTNWGYGMVIETGETTLLFDTGADGDILLDNMAKLGFDPQEIDVVVISHLHGDHTGGLRELLSTGVKPVVYTFSPLINDMGTMTKMVEVTSPVEILPGIHTTGRLGTSIHEQALILETSQGLIIVTGCAHPGIVEIVRSAKELVDGDVALVMGGFHLREASRHQIESIIADLQELGVQHVAPSHCTGDLARNLFAEAFGDECILPGVGQQFVR